MQPSWRYIDDFSALDEDSEWRVLVNSLWNHGGFHFSSNVGLMKLEALNIFSCLSTQSTVKVSPRVMRSVSKTEKKLEQKVHDWWQNPLHDLMRSDCSTGLNERNSSLSVLDKINTRVFARRINFNFSWGTEDCCSLFSRWFMLGYCAVDDPQHCEDFMSAQEHILQPQVAAPGNDGMKVRANILQSSELLSTTVCSSLH